MLVAVARDFVAQSETTTHEIGVPLCDPAQEEERRMRVVRRERTQDRVHADVEARRHGIPVLTRERLAQVGDLKVLLHIEGQGVQEAFALHAVTTRSRTA